MSKNLVTRNGNVIHAPAQGGIGTRERITLCSNLRRQHGYEIRQSDLLELQGESPVTCKNCCRILGIEAPKSLPTAKEMKAMRDFRPEPTRAEREAAIEVQRAAEWDNTAARLACESGVRTWEGESYAAWLTKGTPEFAEHMSTVQIAAQREYDWSVKLAAKTARRMAKLGRKG
jgi:hypothetical protein